MKLENIFLNLVVHLMKIILTINKMTLIYFGQYIYDSHVNLLDFSHKVVKNKFLLPLKILDFGSKHQEVNSTTTSIKSEFWYLLTGRTDNSNKILQIRDSIEKIFNISCNILSSRNNNEAMELVESILQSFYPLKTQFITFCTDTIKFRIQDEDTKKVVLIVKTDETLLLTTVLNNLSHDRTITSKELKKIEYFYFNETQYRNLCNT
ncbi:hypothetical protein CPAV1605_1423 [seawater metagenome]|uniref:Uncharacterized protein n=1 Tax=seawater metagenome TaxID=1561972 RepID=A0A5E8CK11_9ZZZZ